MDDNNNGEMNIVEFNNLISLIYDDVGKVEVDELFKHFDKKGLGSITKQDFTAALNQSIKLENTLKSSLHDIMTPC